MTIIMLLLLMPRALSRRITCVTIAPLLLCFAMYALDLLSLLFLELCGHLRQASRAKLHYQLSNARRRLLCHHVGLVHVNKNRQNLWHISSTFTNDFLFLTLHHL